MRGGRDRNDARATSRQLFLLAATEEGYRGLIKLVTDFYLGDAGRAEPVTLRRPRRQLVRDHRPDRRA